MHQNRVRQRPKMRGRVMRATSPPPSLDGRALNVRVPPAALAVVARRSYDPDRLAA
jgi:hypothetical protein